MLTSAMFPGHFMGLNLLNANHHHPPSAGLLPQNLSMSGASSTSTNSNQQPSNRPIIQVSTAQSPNLFPPSMPPASSSIAVSQSIMNGFQHHQSIIPTSTPTSLQPFWSHLAFPHFLTGGGALAPNAMTTATKNGIPSTMQGPIDFSAYWLKNAANPYLRPPIPPTAFMTAPSTQIPQQPHPQPPMPAAPACIPKWSQHHQQQGGNQNTIGGEPPAKKRNIDRSMAAAAACSTPNPSQCPSIGECCPICRQALPGPQDLRRHLIDDSQKTEEQFLELKRKLTSVGIGGAPGSSMLMRLPSSPDPAVKTRLDTYQRVRENRMNRMREKLAAVQLSNSVASPVMNRKNIFSVADLAHHSKEGKTTPRSTTSSRSSGAGGCTTTGSRSSSTTPRSTALGLVRSPPTMVMMMDDREKTTKTPTTPSSSISISPTSSSAQQQGNQNRQPPGSRGVTPPKSSCCKFCHGSAEITKVNGECGHILCGQCWDRAVGETVEHPVCPICAIPVQRQDVVEI